MEIPNFEAGAFSMAEPSPSVIHLLRRTIKRIRDSRDYQWGHMGSCNCGFLAQEISSLSRREIHASALERSGDWSNQLNEYCPTSGLLMDVIISSMLEAGFSRDDLVHLERLSDPAITGRLPDGVHLQFNVKNDVITYLSTWSDYLEEMALEEIALGELETPGDSGSRNRMQSFGMLC